MANSWASVAPDELSRRMDRALALGLKEALRKLPREFGETFEFDRCDEELKALRQNGDFCYDRPGSGLAYASWYHGERVNQFMGVLRKVPEILERERSWRVVDLGAGTGAVAWALAGSELLAGGGRRPPLQVELVESSRPMLWVGYFLWESLLREFHQEKLESRIRISESNWRNDCWPVDNSTADSPVDLLTAHYLFDSSETATERLEETTDLFLRHLRYEQAKRLLCCTTGLKQAVLQKLHTLFAQHQWAVRPPEEPEQGPLIGVLRKTHEFRQTHHIGRSSSRAPAYQSTARTPPVALCASLQTLFPPPRDEEDRLSRQQRCVVHDKGQHVLVQGTAGAGKTHVLECRIAEFVALAQGEDCALFVTFNKNLVADVAAHVDQILRDRGQTEVRVTPKYDVPAELHCGGVLRVTWGTWDAVVCRLFTSVDCKKMQDSKRRDSELRSNVESCLREISNQKLVQAMPRSVFPEAEQGERQQAGRSLRRAADFLFQEYRTIYYGQARCDFDRYIDPSATKRNGRLHPLMPEARKTCGKLLRQLRDPWIEKRCAAFDGEPRRRYRAIFVDEAQDLTAADYALMERLQADRADWTLAFDTNQAIRTGWTFTPPHLSSPCRWRSHKLVTSWRMPLRICEALAPVAQHLVDAQKLNGFDETCSAVPSPSRLAKPGTRPFVIARRTPEEFATFLRSVWKFYDGKCEKPQPLTVFEKDKALVEALRAELGQVRSDWKDTAEATSVLRDKGREFRWVVWSTRSRCAEPVALQQLVYTILSRCTHYCVIWIKLDDDGRPDSRLAEMFAGPAALRRDRLLVLDPTTASALEHFDRAACSEEK